MLNQSMKSLCSPDSTSFSGNISSKTISECWFDESCILDIDYFVNTLSAIKAKGVRPDLLGSIITQYASKWLPELVADHPGTTRDSPESSTSSWEKKRFFVETLIGVLPPERDSIPCSFSLRLLRTASMVGAEPAYRDELERRVSWQLDHASLKDIMIPSFSHTCGTLLDVELVIRLVQRFVNLEEVGIRSVDEVIKVAKLVDCYLAEAAVDLNFKLSNFIDLAGAIPVHARATHDELYRAIDTYLKIHPGVSKQERKSLCRIIDSRKLSTEASLHAAQNDRLPVRAVIQVLLTEQMKQNQSRRLDWSGSLSGAIGLEPTGRCHSKREVTAQQNEIRTLKDEVVSLQRRCYSMQTQMERLMEKNKKGIFRWMKVGVKPKVEEREIVDDAIGFGRQTPLDLTKKGAGGRATPSRWRKSMSSLPSIF